MFLGKNFSNTLQKHLKHLLSFQLSSPTFGPRTWHPPFHKKNTETSKGGQLPSLEATPQTRIVCWSWKAPIFGCLLSVGGVTSPLPWQHLQEKNLCWWMLQANYRIILPDLCVCVSCLGMIRRFFQNRFALNGKSSDLFLSECTFCQTCHGIP